MCSQARETRKNKQIGLRQTRGFAQRSKPSAKQKENLLNGRNYLPTIYPIGVNIQIYKELITT